MPPKRLTARHWQEIKDANPYDPRTLLGYGRPDYDKLDRQAVAEGYERDGAFRPWYRKHVRDLAAQTGDDEIVALLDRLDEIAEAKREEQELTEALREWESVTALISARRVLPSDATD